MADDSEIAPVKISNLPVLSDNIQALAKQIARGHLGIKEQFYEVGKHYSELKEMWGKNSRKELLPLLQMDDATFCKYVAVGRIPDQLVRKLPNALTILYDVARLEPKETEAADRDGILTTNLTRKKFDEWKSALRGTIPRSNNKPLATIEDPGEEPKRSDAIAVLTKTVAEIGLTIRFAGDQDTRRNVRKQAERAMAYRKDFGNVTLDQLVGLLQNHK